MICGIKKNPDGFSSKELLTLYRLVDQREKSFREDLFRFTNFYSAVCYVILAMTLSGILSLYSKGPSILILIFGPAFTLCMCYLGFRVTSRFYRRIIEEISVKVKVENALGLDSAIPLTEFLAEKSVWEKDESFLPERLAKRRFRDEGSSDFIHSACKGSLYRDNRMFFGLIALFSIILLIVIITLGMITIFS